VGSAIEVECVKTAIDELGPERVMFGSDAPFRSISQCADDYRKMLAPFDEAARGRVLYENAARLYLKR
jgi:predicted TIM-barrel fold metal-dependent hydrolase